MMKTIVINILPLHKNISREGIAHFVTFLSESYGFHENCCFIIDNETADHISRDFYIKIIDTITIERIKEVYINEEEYALSICNDSNDIMERKYNDIITSIQNETSEIVAIFSLYGNRPLEIIASKQHIPFRYIEQSAIRNNAHFSYMLMWFLKNQNYKSGKEVEERYEAFQRVIDRCALKEPMSKIELLMLLYRGDNKDFTDIVSRHNEDRIGVVCSPEYKEICGEWNNDRLIKLACELYGKENVLYRNHPIRESDDSHDEVEKDRSIDSLRFIGHCNTIISAGSNVSFEAMLLGRDVIETGDYAFSQILNRNEEGFHNRTYDDWYLNFIMFCVYVPIELLKDCSYVEWRCNNRPNEAEIFNRNLLFILSRFYPNHIDRILYESKSKREKTMWYCHWKDPTNYRWINNKDAWKQLISMEKNTCSVILCGTGCDSELYYELLNRMDIKVEGFLELDSVGGRRRICGKPVLSRVDLNGIDKDNCFFVFTQRSYYIRLLVKKELSRMGVNNYIEL